MSREPRKVQPERKKVLFLTGTRADFGKLKPLIEQTRECARFEYRVYVTGMHMLSRYGYTYTEVSKAGFRGVFPYINQIDSVGAQQDLVLADTVRGLAYFVREFRPDLIVVHGDRVEALAGAIVGALNNTLVAHIEGGELSGTVDEIVRHAVSKLSHVHFVANRAAKKRLVQMGEAPASVFVIGSPDIDVMLSGRLPTLDAVRRRYSIRFKDYLIFMYHPVTMELRDLSVRIATVLDALVSSRLSYVVIYPNNDPGSQVIMEAIAGLNGQPNFRLLPSMRFEYFLSLLRSARAIVGNSSAGVREAPVYGVPSVNIGSRQMSRFSHTSIVDVPEDREQIISVLQNLPERARPSYHFGDGKSADRFITALLGKRFWKIPCQKQFCDFPEVMK